LFLKKYLTPTAQELRNNPTQAERQLWSILRAEGMGMKFRRQAVIGQFIVDFVCYERKLVIEVDGGQHHQNQQDVKRDAWLKSEGFRVLRFWNNDVLGNLDGVYQKIEDALRPPSLALPTASAFGGLGEGDR
jgi:very-short-patch-repair endonuclease